MSSEVSRAAAVGDVVTVNKWMTARGYTHGGQLLTVIQQAVSHGHDNICQLLFDCKDIRNYKYATHRAFITACNFNQLSIAKHVIQHCPIETSILPEALLNASVTGSVQIVRWLTSEVLYLSHPDCIRWTFVTACVSGNISDIQQLATRVHSDVTSVMSQALRFACYKNRHDVVKWLTSHTTADVSSASVINTFDGKMTSLMAACDRGHNRIAIQLLQCVTPHTVNMTSGKAGDTALHLTCFSETEKRLYTACSRGDVNAMSDLLETCDVDLQDSYGRTSLHIACAYGHVETTRTLLSSFARIDIEDSDGRTPAMAAKLGGFKILKQYLGLLRNKSRDKNSTLTRVTDNNTDTVSISLSCAEKCATQQDKVTQVKTSYQVHLD